MQLGLTRDCHEALRRQLAGFKFVHIAPDPRLSRFNRADKRMFGAVEMLGGVLVLRRIAAAHVPARQAQAQMNPAIAKFDTLLAHMRVRGFDLDLIEVSALTHDPSLAKRGLPIAPPNSRLGRQTLIVDDAGSLWGSTTFVKR